MSNEPTNENRAAFAEEGLLRYYELKNNHMLRHTEHPDALSDFLADLMHWAHAHGVDFQEAICRAGDHFQYEHNEQKQGD